VGVAGIDSNGNIYPGNGTNYNSSRYIYDDSTNYATRFSSTVYVPGIFRTDYGPVTIIELWKEGSGATYGLTATSGADLANCGTMLDGTWFSPNGKIQVRLYVNVDSMTGGTYNFQLHNVTDDNYPVVNTDGSMSGTTSGMKDSGWKNATMNGLKWICLYGWVSDSQTNFNPAFVLVRPQLQ